VKQAGPFFSISGSEIHRDVVGVGAARRDWFEQAKKKATCIHLYR